MDDLTKKCIKLDQDGMTHRKIAKELGVSYLTVYGRLRRWYAKHPDQKPSKGNRKSSQGTEEILTAVSEDEFIKPFDWKGKLRDGIDRLVPESDTAVVQDADFRRHLKIPTDKWKKLKRMDEFKPFQLSISNSIYWCQEETKRRLQAKIELAEEVM